MEKEVVDVPASFESTTFEDVPEQGGPPPTAQPGVVKLSEFDAMKLENIFLKIQNVKMQRDRLAQDTLNADKMILELQKELVTLRDMLSQKYGIDFGHATIQNGMISRQE